MVISELHSLNRSWDSFFQKPSKKKPACILFKKRGKNAPLLGVGGVKKSDISIKETTRTNKIRQHDWHDPPTKKNKNGKVVGLPVDQTAATPSSVQPRCL